MGNAQEPGEGFRPGSDIHRIRVHFYELTQAPAGETAKKSQACLARRQGHRLWSQMSWV